MTDNYVSADELNAASVEGEVNAASVEGEVMGSSVLGDVTVAGVIIREGGFDEIPPATTDAIGGIIVGDHLSVTEEGRLSVVVADSSEEDNTNPISAAAVYMEVGNINALLQTI